VAFSGNQHFVWSLWVVWVFWALIAVVWLAACALILWAPRRANRSVFVELDEPSVDRPLARSVR
jgi:type VI protein secretion system component VasK